MTSGLMTVSAVAFQEGFFHVRYADCCKKHYGRQMLTPETITSTANPLLKEVRRAVARGSLTEGGCCVAETFHLLEEALRSGCEVKTVLASESARAAVMAQGRRLAGVKVRLLRGGDFPSAGRGAAQRVRGQDGAGVGKCARRRDGAGAASGRRESGRAAWRRLSICWKRRCAAGARSRRCWRRKVRAPP